jgi:hypothetical protein
LERETKIQLVVWIIIGLLTFLIIFVVWWAKPITHAPDNSTPDLRLDGWIDLEEDSFKFEVMQEEINLYEYSVKIIVSTNGTRVETINLTSDHDYAKKGDVIAYTNETWIPLNSKSYEIIFIHIEDSVVRYRNTFTA